MTLKKIITSYAGRFEFLRSGDTVAMPYPPGYAHGCNPSMNTANPKTHIDISAGAFRDAADTVNMRLGSGITKRFDATFASGDGNGGRIGDQAVGIWHIYMVFDGSDTDIITKQSVGSAGLPSGWDAYAWAGSFLIRNGLTYNKPQKDYWNASCAGKNMRVLIPSTELSLSGSNAKISFIRHDTDYIINDCYIGAQASGDVYDFDTAPTQITFGGGNAGTTITVDGQESDDISFDFDHTKNHIISAHIGTSGDCAVADAAGITYEKLGTSESSVSNVSGYGDNSRRMIVGKIATGYEIIPYVFRGGRVDYLSYPVIAANLSAAEYADIDVSAVVPSASGSVVDMLIGAHSEAALDTVWLSINGEVASSVAAARHYAIDPGGVHELSAYDRVGFNFVPVKNNKIKYKTETAETIMLFLRAYRVIRGGF